MLFGFRALDSSLKITNLMVVPRLSLCAFSSSLDASQANGRWHGRGHPRPPSRLHTPARPHLMQSM